MKKGEGIWVHFKLSFFSIHVFFCAIMCIFKNISFIAAKVCIIDNKQSVIIQLLFERRGALMLKKHKFITIFFYLPISIYFCC